MDAERDAGRNIGKGHSIRPAGPAPGILRVRRIARPLARVFLALAVVLCASHARADTRVRIAPTVDAELDALLAEHLTLPLLLDAEPGARDRSLDIAAEARKMAALLQSKGYLMARVEVTGSATDADPLVLTPVAGNLYRIGWIRVDGIGSVAPEVADAIEALIDAEVGRTATAGTLDAIRDGVVAVLRRGAHGHAVVPPPELAIDPRTSTAGITLAARPGAALTFGNTIFTGSFRLSGAQAADFVPYRAGDPYSAEAVATLRTALEDTDHFRKVRIELDPTANAIGQTDIHVDLRDRAPDVVELARSSGFGPKLLILAMLVFVLMECLRVTPLWSSRAVRRSVTLAAAGMIGASAPVVVLRLAGFLS